MSSDRDKPSRGGDSVARPTARDVPYTRGADTETESAPRGQRPADLPRDPTYEAELAQVDLAVLRDPKPRDVPSTRQVLRHGHAIVHPSPPESVTPESPGTRASRSRAPGVSTSPEPPSSAGRSVASGTLLSVGAVDPRGKTEKNLETPRMFFSQVDAGSEVYFRPGKIPAVTINPPIETETVMLSDSVDPRRAKTIPPRIDRAPPPPSVSPTSSPRDSDHAVAYSPRSIPDLVLPADSMARGEHDHYAEPPASIASDHDGQIHASLSQFRDEGTPSFSLQGAATRPEPLAARRQSDVPAEPDSAPPDPNGVATHRDLPLHRIQASTPPPASVDKVTLPASRSRVSGAPAPASEGPTPTTASIAAEAPVARPAWHNYAAFFGALAIALLLGTWWTRYRGQDVEPAPTVRLAPPDAPLSDEARPLTPAPIALRSAAPPLAPRASEPALAPAPAAASARTTQRAEPKLSAPVVSSPPSPAPRSSNPSKTARETIF